MACVGIHSTYLSIVSRKKNQNSKFATKNQVKWCVCLAEDISHRKIEWKPTANARVSHINITPSNYHTIFTHLFELIEHDWQTLERMRNFGKRLNSEHLLPLCQFSTFKTSMGASSDCFESRLPFIRQPNGNSIASNGARNALLSRTIRCE